MNQYDPYSMTTDEKRRQLMEMYNLQFNPQPMQPPKPPRMAAPPAGATMATPPAIAFARGPSQMPLQQQAQEMPMGGGMGQLLAGEPSMQEPSSTPEYSRVNNLIMSAFRPTYTDSAQGNYDAFLKSQRRYERIAPAIGAISKFYNTLIDSSGEAIERDFNKPFDEVFSMYIKQLTEPPYDISKSFFDWYVRNRPAAPSPIVKKRREDVISVTPTLPPRGGGIPPSTRMPPIRPPSPEGMK